MPNFDGTGPQGQGPQTGRKLGPCNKTDNTSQVTNSNRRVGRGRAKGVGAGRRVGRGLGRS